MSIGSARVEWLTIVGDIDTWRSLGLSATVDGFIPLFGTALRIVSPEAASATTAVSAISGGTGVEPENVQAGVVGWAISGIDETITSIAGLTTTVVEPLAPTFATHSLGARSIDHVVVMTGDLEPTADDIALATGCELKRIREVGKIRQGFHRIGRGGLIVEVVQHEDDHRSAAEFWGLVIIVEDLDDACAQLGSDRVGEPKDAVQTGRRIATIRSSVGLGTAVALMSA
ncbi:MAG: hypothetical protein O3B90_11075 [Actinomycetota bacterium]|jgi:hypothetical protein|uniref:VOC family protein n=1 Tax=uncultured Ilumatobacter sp. TaxID=879968 RepID=UPI00374FCA8C|nr:hypothetical protein [Actinomycetota bacterium]